MHDTVIDSAIIMMMMEILFLRCAHALGFSRIPTADDTTQTLHGVSSDIQHFFLYV